MITVEQCPPAGHSALTARLFRRALFTFTFARIEIRNCYEYLFDQCISFVGDSAIQRIFLYSKCRDPVARLYERADARGLFDDLSAGLVRKGHGR